MNTSNTVSLKNKDCYGEEIDFFYERATRRKIENSD